MFTAKSLQQHSRKQKTQKTSIYGEPSTPNMCGSRPGSLVVTNARSALDILRSIKTLTLQCELKNNNNKCVLNAL